MRCAPACFNHEYLLKDIAKDVSFKIVFGFVLILDILIMSNSNKRFRNILQSSKKSPYQRNDEINKNFRTQVFRTTILLCLRCYSECISTPGELEKYARALEYQPNALPTELRGQDVRVSDISEQYLVPSIPMCSSKYEFFLCWCCVLR